MSRTLVLVLAAIVAASPALAQHRGGAGYYGGGYRGGYYGGGYRGGYYGGGYRGGYRWGYYGGPGGCGWCWGLGVGGLALGLGALYAAPYAYAPPPVYYPPPYAYPYPYPPPQYAPAASAICPAASGVSAAVTEGGQDEGRRSSQSTSVKKASMPDRPPLPHQADQFPPLRHETT